MPQFYFRQTGEALSKQDNARVIVGAQGVSGYMTRAENCPRCGGQGGSEAWKFTGWTCYQCRGKCKMPRTYRVYTSEKLAKLVTAAEKKAANSAAAAEREAERTRHIFIAWAKPYGKLIGGILMAKRNSFLSDLSLKLKGHRILTDKQMKAAADSIARTTKRLADDAASQFVGEVKERIEFEAIVVGVYDSEGYYGHTDIVKFRDLSGNLFTWFASGYTGLKREDRMSIKGTVKKHDVYRDIKQTILTRCKFDVFEILTPDEAAQAEAIT